MITTRSLLEQLNQAQREAVLQTDGPMLILAGAGSGKTRTITYKIAHVIDSGKCRPEQILAVTFTNKAATEMRSRVEGLLSELSAPPLICTFHSFAVRVLRRFATRLGYGNDFTICDAADQRAVYKRVMDDLGFDEKGPAPRLAQAVVSRAKNQGWSPDAYEARSRDSDSQVMATLYRAYQAALKRSNAMDFDDLILQTVRLFLEDQEVAERVAGRYRYLLIDEYQDTNAPQNDLIRHLTALHQNVSAVGDEDQSIYRFRGADIGNILRFEEDFPGAVVIKLEQNYRSTQVILEAATAVVSHNSERKGKVLWTERTGGELIDLYVADDAREEAEFVSHQIYQFLQIGKSNIATLYRTNFQSRQFEDALRRLGITYKLVGGESFYHRKEVKDALAYLRAARNPHDDVSLLRIINEPARGIGKTTLEKLLALSKEASSSVWGSVSRALEERLFPSRTTTALKRFSELLLDCQKHLELPLHLALEKILQRSGYRGHLRNQEGEESDNRLLNLDELTNVAQEYSQREQSLQDFLDATALHAEADDYDQSARVTLMTLHNAKGLEFPVVFLAGMEEGLFPHSRSILPEEIEEERRLCYVGITRAQEKLFLSYSRRRRFYGRSSDAGEFNRPSRFLAEFPQALLRVSESRRTARTGSLLFSRAQPPEPKRPYQGKTYNSKQDVEGFLRQTAAKRGAGNRALTKGDLVEHREFGRGRVLRVEPATDDLKVTVQFSGLGIKKLLQRFAQLRRI